MSDIKVRVGQQNSIKVLSSILGDRSGTLSALNDVNTSNGLLDGMVLVYNGVTKEWDATLTLTPGATQNLDINGGSF